MVDTSKSVPILIVEDEALVATLITDVLREMGFTIIGTAASGLEALALVAEVRPRLALIDIRLTGPVDGIELAIRLREEYGIPGIFLSGTIDPATARRAQAAQPLGLMEKPFRPSEVFNAIERALTVIPE
ncbi:MAG TPA: response regulator [Stellaceae bacterium]|jgi:CheY-like chemotaxis protein|nr:response regulator [Stellaceae bacterium]